MKLPRGDISCFFLIPLYHMTFVCIVQDHQDQKRSTWRRFELTGPQAEVLSKDNLAVFEGTTSTSIQPAPNCIMAFVASTTSGSSPHRASPRCRRQRRRAFLGHTLSAAAGVLLSSMPVRATEKQPNKQWRDEQLCSSCRGCGKQTCSMCSGSGLLSVDDSVVQQDHTCPNCMGQGSVRCPACIGLGLADTRGILRDGRYTRASEQWARGALFGRAPCRLALAVKTER